MTGNAIDWAESKLDWQDVNQKTLQKYAQGYAQEDALKEAINEEVEGYVNSKTGKSGAYVGIFDDGDKLWGGGTDMETKEHYNGFSSKVVDDIDFLQRQGREIEGITKFKGFISAERVGNNTLRYYEFAADGKTELEFERSYNKDDLDYAENKGII